MRLCHLKHYKYNPKLSTGFRQIVRFLTQNPDVAARPINAVAAECGTRPSSLIGFAKRLGCSCSKQLQPGFSDQACCQQVILCKIQEDNKYS
jgi:DNA-binding MurR/RpiR family transcriptional regulator